MKRTITAVSVVFLGISSAYADITAPNDVSFEDGAVAVSVTCTGGSAESGRAVFQNRKQGNCLACHVNSDAADAPFHGEVGPSLDGAGDRWSEAELRGIVTNSKLTFEDTIMPAFYIESGYNRPLEKFAGKSILSAEQVEDVVSYQLTLKE